MAAFATQSQVEALMGHGPTSTATQPTSAQLLSQMQLDADRIRTVLSGAGFVGDPGGSTALYGLCANANALLSAAWGLGMWRDQRDGDAKLRADMLETVQGCDCGLLARIVREVEGLLPSDGGWTRSAVSAPERLQADLIHWDEAS